MRRGFTLVEMLVVIAIITVLAAILLPVLSKAREKGSQANCAAHVRQIALAFLMYAEDWEGGPPDANWLLPLEKFTDGKTIWRCRSHDNPSRPTSYAVNGYALWDTGNNFGWPFSAPFQPTRTALLWDGSGGVQYSFTWYNNGPNYWGVSQRHAGRANFAFYDGHVKNVDTQIIREIGLGNDDGNYWVNTDTWPPANKGTPWADRWRMAEFWTYPYYQKID